MTTTPLWLATTTIRPREADIADDLWMVVLPALSATSTRSLRTFVYCPATASAARAARRKAVENSDGFRYLR